MRIGAIDDADEGPSGRGFSAIGLPVRIAVGSLIVALIAIAARMPSAPAPVPMLNRTSEVPAIVGTAPCASPSPASTPSASSPAASTRRPACARTCSGAAASPPSRRPCCGSP